MDLKGAVALVTGPLDGTRDSQSSARAGRALRIELAPEEAADKDDCADMVVAMCRTETMTGQTVVIDSGRIFH